MIVITVASILILAVGITLYFIGRHSTNPDTLLNSLLVSADSIVAAQVTDIEMNKGIPSAENVMELKKSIVLYNKVVKDSPDSYTKKQTASEKVVAINDLIDLIEDYEYTDRLVENARITQMVDSVVKYTPVRENQILRIYNLTQQLK